MKMTPIAQGTGTPAGANVGNERMPADRIAAAKAVASGKMPVNITESDTPVDEQIEKAKRDIRKIRMKTQVSPDRLDPSLVSEEAAPHSANVDVVEQAQPATEATKPLSPAFAELARQKRALQLERKAFDEEKAKLTQPNMEGFISKADLQADPLKLFESGVITYDQLTEAILANPQSPDYAKIKALEAKIDALEKGVDTKLSERDSNAERQVLAEISREANQLVSQGDDYALVRENGYAAKAVDLIHKTWKQTGEILDTSEALELVENQLLEDALKIANMEKVRSKLTPAQVQEQQQQQKQGMRTLTNRDGSAAPMDKRTRALLAFSGQLRKG